MPERVTRLTIAPDTWPYSGAERRVVDLELLDAGDRRRKGELSKRHVGRAHAVDDVADRFFAVAGGIERQRAGAADRRAREPGLRRRHRSGRQRSEIDEVAAVERDFLDGRRRHDVSDDARRAIEQRQFRAHHHRFTPGVDGQLEIAHQRAADLERQRFDAFGSESWSLGRDLVRAGRNAGT